MLVNIFAVNASGQNLEVAIPTDTPLIKEGEKASFYIGSEKFTTSLDYDKVQDQLLTVGFMHHASARIIIETALEAAGYDPDNFGAYFKDAMSKELESYKRFRQHLRALSKPS